MNSFVNYLIEGSLCMALGLVFYKSFLEGLTFFEWNRYMLLFLISCSVVVPLISVELRNGETFTGKQFIDSFQWYEMEAAGTPLNEERFSFPWHPFIWMVYFLGSGYFFIRFIMGICKAFLLISASKKYKHEHYTLAVNDSFSPSSFFHYILLPDYHPKDFDQRRMILHESTHVNRKHTWDLVLIQLIKIIFWFNPLIFLYEKLIKEVHEFKADQAVTRLYSPFEYARLLVKQINIDPDGLLINKFNQFQTKKRIIMMNKRESGQLQKCRFLCAIPLVALMLTLFSFETGNEKKLIGEWKGVEFNFEQAEGPEIPEMIAGGKSLHLSGKLIIMEDGKYQIHNTNPEMNEEGSWKIDNKTALTLTAQDGRQTMYTIISVKENEMIISHDVSTETPEGRVSGKITLTYSK